ncbi:TPA: hypothetical protein G8O65_004082 [Salmonella enterica]|uniref:Uncharacterized protein n=1 Tax=Salmonella enterica TaxID=28901 RepID=A0A761QJM5_SALER|nr:hypothetical protein [Salmonella enterica]HDJ1974077.1 hypothetical protein [Salmonella enterica subsp. enterica]HAG5568847.1 hypothetical protein [Salmonella enterica]HAK0560870.1 hypothetical protein [Salmonella enterica]HAK0611014.1 hypothetical protein [Salmonella enterica]
MLALFQRVRYFLWRRRLMQAVSSELGEQAALIAVELWPLSPENDEFNWRHYDAVDVAKEMIKNHHGILTYD